jgi:hypothetical protein
MANRREFVRGGVATLAAVSFRRALGAGNPPTAAATNRTVIAIADAGFAAAEDFAVEAQRHGIVVHGFANDVGGLWLHEIEPGLRSGAIALVGLSGPGVLLCLETLARAHGFGTVFRAERPARGPGWTAVATRHALAAAAASRDPGASILPPTEHVVRPNAAAPPLLAWTIARPARRTTSA